MLFGVLFVCLVFFHSVPVTESLSEDKRRFLCQCAFAPHTFTMFLGRICQPSPSRCLTSVRCVRNPSAAGISELGTTSLQWPMFGAMLPPVCVCVCVPPSDSRSFYCSKLSLQGRVAFLSYHTQRSCGQEGGSGA